MTKQVQNFTQARRERKKETKTIIRLVFKMHVFSPTIFCFFPHHLCICEMRMKQKWSLANSPSAKSESHSLHFLVNFNYAVLYYKLDPGRPFPGH